MNKVYKKIYLLFLVVNSTFFPPVDAQTLEQTGFDNKIQKYYFNTITVDGLNYGDVGQPQSCHPNIGIHPGYRFVTNKNKKGFCSTNSFTGSVSTAWENASNWTCGVPGPITDAIIPAFSIVEISSVAAARSLSVNPSANVKVNPGFSLNIYN